MGDGSHTVMGMGNGASRIMAAENEERGKQGFSLHKHTDTECERYLSMKLYHFVHLLTFSSLPKHQTHENLSLCSCAAHFDSQLFR